jgi:acyl-homoserine lactone acylase PvdQ
MKVTTCVAVGVLLAPLLGSADTGFLDRSVHIGAMTYRYQVYVPIEHSRAKEWPVVIELHGFGAQGPDGLLPTSAGPGATDPAESFAFSGGCRVSASRGWQTMAQCRHARADQDLSRRRRFPSNNPNAWSPR